MLEFFGDRENILQICHHPLTIDIEVKDPTKIDLEYFRREGYQIAVDQHWIQVIAEDNKALYQKLDAAYHQRRKWTPKSIGQAILDTFSSVLMPLIPMLMAAAMFKTVLSVLGPQMLHILSQKDPLYTLFTFVGDAGFYFFPVVVGYTAAKKFHATPVLGMFMGAVLIHPTLIDIVEKGSSMTVYGIPMILQNYSGTILPALLSVWILSYVEHFFRKILPSSVEMVFAPFLTMVVMLPIALCLLGPLGQILGNGLCTIMLRLGNAGGLTAFLSIIALGALWQFIVIGGLHWLFISSIYMILAGPGHENIITCAIGASSFALGGMCLGALLRLKNAEEKSLCVGYIIAQLIGAVTEPGVYGIGFRYKKPLIGLMAGGAVGAGYGAVVHLTAYNFLPVASFLTFLNYMGGSTFNFINGIAACLIGFVAAAVVTYIVGVE